jgi:hypothetical protein
MARDQHSELLDLVKAVKGDGHFELDQVAAGGLEPIYLRAAEKCGQLRKDDDGRSWVQFLKVKSDSAVEAAGHFP